MWCPILALVGNDRETGLELYLYFERDFGVEIIGLQIEGMVEDRL